MTIERQLILRVPVIPRHYALVEWKEVKGPRCVPVRAIAGASLAGSDRIDFVLRNRQRLRALLDSDCEGLDFYGGFYLSPEDDTICARRDIIRSRAGGACRIRAFHGLVPHIVEER